MVIVTLNNDDPSIVYTGLWEKDGSSMGTTFTSAGDENTFATVTFTGSRISVRGNFKNDQPSSSYTVDTLEGEKTTTFVPPPLWAANFSYFNVLFFASDPLSPTGQHKLVMTPIRGTLLINSLEIEQDDNPSSLPPLTSSSTLQSIPSESTFSSSSRSSTFSMQQSSIKASPMSSSWSSSLSFSAPQSSSSGNTAGTVPPTQGKSGVAVGAIIGGILGALTLICIFVLALLYLRRRRREDRLGGNKGAPPPAVWASTHIQHHPSIIPYDASLPHQQHSKVQLLVGTQMGAVTTEGITGGVSTIPVQHSPPAEQTPAVAQSLGNVVNLSTIASQGALRDVQESFPSSGNNWHDPPPEYQE